MSSNVREAIEMALDEGAEVGLGGVRGRGWGRCRSSARLASRRFRNDMLEGGLATAAATRLPISEEGSRASRAEP